MFEKVIQRDHHRLRVYRRVYFFKFLKHSAEAANDVFMIDFIALFKLTTDLITYIQITFIYIPFRIFMRRPRNQTGQE